MFRESFIFFGNTIVLLTRRRKKEKRIGCFQKRSFLKKDSVFIEKTKNSHISFSSSFS